MAHSYTQLHAHIIFACKGRKNLLYKDLRLRLFPYIAACTQKKSAQVIEINGVEDHIHILVKYPAHVKLSDLVAAIKANSSRWIKEEFTQLVDFSWQEGYGAFSVSASQIETIRVYIQNQESHHQRVPFVDEVKAFMNKHGMEFDEGGWQ